MTGNNRSLSRRAFLGKAVAATATVATAGVAAKGLAAVPGLAAPMTPAPAPCDFILHDPRVVGWADKRTLVAAYMAETKAVYAKVGLVYQGDACQEATPGQRAEIDRRMMAWLDVALGPMFATWRAGGRSS